MTPPTDATPPPGADSGAGGGSPPADVLREALAGLRHEIESRFPGRASTGSRDARFDWMHLFEELRRRLGALGMDEHLGEVDEFGFDPSALRRARPLLDFLYDRYWRVNAAGIEHVPWAAPVLFVANRSGLLPWDGLMLAHAVERAHPQQQRPRFLVADWLVTLPFAQATLARLGGVRACRENADRLLRHGHSVVAFPEGMKGAAKVYRERYRLKRFGRGGVVRTALSSRVPLVPVAVVGAEEVHPVLFKVETWVHELGLPFLPITPTFPALGPLGLVPLPSKWEIRFGPPMATGDLGPEAVDDDLLLSRLTEELRERVQALVDQGIRERRSVWG